MQDNALQNNPLAFFAGLVLFFAGLVATLFYLFIRTATESALLPGQHFRLKHFVVALVIAAAGAVLAAFAQPPGPATSDRPRSNRQAATKTYGADRVCGHARAGPSPRAG